MSTRVQVIVLGRHHMGIAVVTGQQRVDGTYHRARSGHGERPSLAEIVLHVDDDQRPHLPTVSADPRVSTRSTVRSDMTLFDFFQAEELPAPAITPAQAHDIAKTHFGIDAVVAALGSQQ